MANVEVGKLIIDRANDFKQWNPCIPPRFFGDGDTALHWAALNGVKTILIDNIDRIDVNHANNNGETPLHLAAANGDVWIIKFLVEKGARSSKTNNGKTPEEIAKVFHSSNVNPILQALWPCPVRREIQEQHQMNHLATAMATSDDPMEFTTNFPPHVKANESSPEECKYMYAKTVTQVRNKSPIVWNKKAVDKNDEEREPITFSLRTGVNYECYVSGNPKLKKDKFDACSFYCADEGINNDHAQNGLKINQWFTCGEDDDSIGYNILLAFAFPGEYFATFRNKDTNEIVCLIKIYVTSCRPAKGCTVDKSDHIVICTSKTDIRTKHEEKVKERKNRKRGPQNELKNAAKKQRKCPLKKH
mmetsp:Transcript_7728/g.8504  ORF Transcript_7728/g.8504 Transcript_7728/m.8504 type:complete len:360 (+) Transcript_7728:34-1113(+)